jgi:N-acetylmuramoyl-L-alanine amidase
MVLIRFSRAQLTIVGPSVSTIIVGGTNVVSSVEQQLPAGWRYAGSDRYATCAKVLYGFGPTFVDPPAQIGVATGDNFPDALAAGPYLAKLNRSLVLVRRDTVPDPIWAWFLHAEDNIKPGPSISGITIFGSTAAVSAACEDELRGVIQ